MICGNLIIWSDLVEQLWFVHDIWLSLMPCYMINIFAVVGFDTCAQDIIPSQHKKSNSPWNSLCCRAQIWRFWCWVCVFSFKFSTLYIVLKKKEVHILLINKDSLLEHQVYQWQISNQAWNKLISCQIIFWIFFLRLIAYNSL